MMHAQRVAEVGPHMDAAGAVGAEAAAHPHEQPEPEHVPSLPLPPQRRAERQLSARSEFIMEQLLDFERQFEDIDASVAAIEAAFRSGELTPGKARDDLAQLEARLDRLQCEGVDSIETFELQSGKDQARALRKVLTRRAEQMHGKFDDIFQEIKGVLKR